MSDHNETRETMGDDGNRADRGCDNTTHVCSCAFWAKGAVEHDDDCNIWLNDDERARA